MPESKPSKPSPPARALKAARAAAAWCANAWRGALGWAQRRPLLTIAAIAVVLGAYGAGLGAAGWLLGKGRDLGPVRSWMVAGKKVYSGLKGDSYATGPSRWEPAITHLHDLEIAEVELGWGATMGGAIAEMDGNIVFSAPQGRMGYLSRDLRLVPLDVTPPMNLDALLAAPIYKDPLFQISEFRVLDLFAKKTGEGAYDLYVSHHRFAGDCFEWVLSRIAFTVDADGVAPAGDWEEMFVARPCMVSKQASVLFAGSEAGGRIVALDDDTLLLSIGDHQFDGFNDPYQAAMDPASDLGKIIRFDIASKTASIYAMGLRNPQGLTVAADGRVWETEHGPQGGDEINLIREGANYGWPKVSYGVNYGYPRRDWPFNDVQGGHEGYEKPAFAFVPSIGISNLVVPDADEFPLWRDDLVVLSMRANTMFLARREGDRIVYAEPFVMQGRRLRDVISMSDGRLAILEDSGVLHFIRNADRPHAGPTAETFTVTGVEDVALTRAQQFIPENVSPAERGRQVFASRCSSCHTIDGGPGPGPSLKGVYRRKIGGVEGYPYSPALADHGGVWNEANLTSFLTEPRRRFDGTTMPQPTISWEEVPAVVAYLKTR